MRLEAGRPECIRGRVCISVGICDASVCLLACMRCPRLLFLIDPAQHLSDLQDVLEPVRNWWMWKEGERKMARKKGRREK